MALQTLAIAEIVGISKTGILYDDVTLRVREWQLTTLSKKSAVAFAEVPGLARQRLDRQTPGQSKQFFNSISFRVVIDKDGPRVFNGKFRLN